MKLCNYKEKWLLQKIFLLKLWQPAFSFALLRCTGVFAFRMRTYVRLLVITWKFWINDKSLTSLLFVKSCDHLSGYLKMKRCEEWLISRPTVFKHCVTPVTIWIFNLKYCAILKYCTIWHHVVRIHSCRIYNGTAIGWFPSANAAFSGFLHIWISLPDPRGTQKFKPTPQCIIRIHSKFYWHKK